VSDKYIAPPTTAPPRTNPMIKVAILLTPLLLLAG
jgi:hypothetical protein